jgi:hypothetical protein
MRYIRILVILSIALLLISCEKKTTDPALGDVVSTPIFLLPSGEYEEGQYISIRCSMKDAEIHYTLDSTNPTYNSPIYTQSLQIPQFFVNNSDSCIIKARAFKADYLPSEIATATYSVNYNRKVAMPTVLPIGQEFTQCPIQVTITCATPGAQIRFTDDGTEPDYNSTLYENSFTITNFKHIKAKAFKAGWNSSNVISKQFFLLVSELGSYPTPDNAFSVAVNSDYAYVAAGNSGIRIIDVSDKTNPQEVNIFNPTEYANVVIIVGAYAYVGGGNSMKILDITNPIAPIQISSYPVSNGVKSIDIDGNYAYLACPFLGLRIVDIANPANPVTKGTFSLNNAVSVSVSGDYAYVADILNGIYVINVSNHTSPQQAGYFDTPGNAFGIDVQSIYAYVADGTAGLGIYNISSHGNPVLISYLDTPDFAVGVHFYRGILYLADGNSGFRLINVDTASTPQEICSYDTPDSAYGVLGYQDYAFVADGLSGLRILSPNIFNWDK